MNPHEKQAEIAAGSSEPSDLLTDEMPKGVDSRQPAYESWQFIQQGYDWTDGSLRTRGYRTDFDSVREVAHVPPPEPRQQDSTRSAGRLDWRHPDHLDVVQEFVSSLTEPAAASTSAELAGPDSNDPKPIEVTPRLSWRLLGAGLAAVVSLLVLVSLFWGKSQTLQPVRPEPVEGPLAIAAAPAEPTQYDPMPNEVPSPSLSDTNAESTSTTAAPEEGVVSSQPDIAAKTRLELATREIQVSGRAVAAVIVLKRTGSTRGSVRVRWKTVPGTATPGTDYESVSAIVKFADGQAVRTLFVPILQPPSRSEPRTFSIKLQRLGNSPRLGANTLTTVTILEDVT